jgi:hypothetical protein
MMKAFVLFVFGVIFSAFAVGEMDKPPQGLLVEVMSYQIVIDQQCNVPQLGWRNVECIATYDEKNDRLWLILFDANLKMQFVFMVDERDDLLAMWCRQDTCV